jgi:hypothetical protein
MIDLTAATVRTPVLTIEQVIAREDAAQWPEEARDLLRRVTAQERHESRKARCLQVALHVARAIDPGEGCDGEIANLLLQAGWQGTGGPRNIGAESPGNGDRCSARIWPWGTVCGKGRAAASDGPAWCQALAGAQFVLREQVTGEYEQPSGAVMALEAILEWAKTEEQVAWADQVRDHLRAHAARQMLSRWTLRQTWAEVYAACCYPLTHEQANTLRCTCEASQEAAISNVAVSPDPADIWRAEE